MSKNSFTRGNQSCDDLDLISDPLEMCLESESGLILQRSHLYMSSATF